jgi:thiol-disulfide isomerase/thioredoxin
LFYDKENKSQNNVLFQFKKTFNRLNYKLDFVQTEQKTEHEKLLSETMKVLPEDLPLLLMIDARSEEMVKYKYTGDYSVESIESFVEDYFNKNLFRHYRSDPSIPNQNGPIYDIVASDYNEYIFLTEDKYIFVLFYSPTCQHSLSFIENTFNKLPEKLNKNKILLTKIDYTRNEVDQISIIGYPTIRLYMKNDRSIFHEYKEYDRSVDGILNFLKQHITENISSNNSPNDDL